MLVRKRDACRLSQLLDKWWAGKRLTVIHGQRNEFHQGPRLGKASWQLDGATPRTGRREVVRFEDAPRNVGEGQEPMGSGKRIEKKRDKKPLDWQLGRNPSRTTRRWIKTEGKRERKRWGLAIQCRQKVEQLSPERAGRRPAPACPRVELVISRHVPLSSASGFPLAGRTLSESWQWVPRACLKRGWE